MFTEIHIHVLEASKMDSVEAIEAGDEPDAKTPQMPDMDTVRICLEHSLLDHSTTADVDDCFAAFPKER